MLEPAEYVVMRLPYFDHMRKWFEVFLDRILPVGILCCALIFSYCVGFLDGALRHKIPVVVIDSVCKKEDSKHATDGGQGVVASKNGTTFYYPWCSGRNRIKPENERWFEDPAEALKYGLKPAKNCLGL